MTYSGSGAAALGCRTDMQGEEGGERVTAEEERGEPGGEAVAMDSGEETERGEGGEAASVIGYASESERRPQSCSRRRARVAGETARAGARGSCKVEGQAAGALSGVAVTGAVCRTELLLTAVSGEEWKRMEREGRHCLIRAVGGA